MQEDYYALSLPTIQTLVQTTSALTNQCSSFFLLLVFILSLSSAHAQENRIVVQTEQVSDTISKHIYGHFAEHLGRGIYDGLYVGKDSDIPNMNGHRTDLVNALRELDMPVLRWPGGCFAEQYQWRDGIGPVADRPEVVNIFWGGVPEDNSFGTHEFLELCELLDTEPYIAVNIASGTVKDASNWIEYVTSDTDSDVTRLRKTNGRDKPWDVKFWGIGNENWGCGGNMNAEYYTNVFKQYSTYCPGEFKVASGGINDDLEWTRTFMKELAKRDNFSLAQGLSYHYYTICNTWSDKGDATRFTEREWFQSMRATLQMEGNLKEHIAIMDEYDPDNQVALIADEWGTWYKVEEGTNPGFLYQQNTLRDALVAAIGLNIFNNQARRVKMANIAQTVNVLQAMILTRETEMVRTPTYHVFKMYKVHQDAALLPTTVTSSTYACQGEEVSALSVSASRDASGTVHITIANVHPTEDLPTSISLDGMNALGDISGEIISAATMNAFNDFGKAEEVTSKPFNAFNSNGSAIEVSLPAKSVVLLSIGG